MSTTTGLEDMHKLLAMLPGGARRRMVVMYRESLGSQLTLLHEALSSEDEEDAASLSHRIAGSAAMMQDSALSQPARAMELALRDGRPEEAHRLWPLVQSHAARTLEALEREAELFTPA